MKQGRLLPDWDVSLSHQTNHKSTRRNGPRERNRCIAASPSRKATRSDRGLLQTLRKQFVAQRPNHCEPEAAPTRTRFSPGLGAVNRQVLQVGMLSSRLIGSALFTGPTSLYILTPLPRVCLISTSWSTPAAYPIRSVRSIHSGCQPCRKWIAHKPPSSSSSQLPCSLSTLSPNLSQHDGREKHLRTMNDPVARTASPYTDPSVKGPRSHLLSSQRPSTKPSDSQYSPLLPLSGFLWLTMAFFSPTQCSSTQ